MLIVSPNEWKRVEWRNRMGTSAEIVARPDIILNQTEIPANVAFSTYPGFDRTLVLIAGKLTLSGETGNIVLLPRNVHSFAGEERIYASIEKPPVVAFNILADRQHWCVNAPTVFHGTSAAREGKLTLLHVAQGQARLATEITLHTGETLFTTERVDVSGQSGWSFLCELAPISALAANWRP